MISIIIPAYNVSEYIERCLKSVINQTVKDIEIIVIDDGSTDDTLRVINRIASNTDRNFKIISQQNRGVSAARNIGIEKSTGDYLIFIDADDWIEDSYCEDIINTIKMNKPDIIIADIAKNENQVINQEKFIKADNIQYLKLLLTNRICPSMCTKAVRKDIFLANNIRFDETIKIGEDLLISVLLGCFSRNIVKINKVQYHYFNRENSVINTINDNVLNIINVIEKIEGILNNKNIISYLEHELNVCKYMHIVHSNLIAIKPYNQLHKKLYKYFKSMPNIDSKLAYSYSLMDKRYINISRVHCKLYQLNYNLGSIFYIIRQLRIKIKNKYNLIMN